MQKNKRRSTLVSTATHSALTSLRDPAPASPSPVSSSFSTVSTALPLTRPPSYARALALFRPLAVLLLAGSSVGAHAQSAGSFVLSTGWMHIAPQVSTEPMQTQVNTARGSMSLSDSSISSSIRATNTIGLTGTYFITDHIAAEIAAGLPPRFSIYGAGSAEQYGKLGSARMWSPAILLKYYFGQANAAFRPYVGIGASYIWFSGANISNSAFETNKLGGDTTISVDKGLAPVLNAGLSYSFAKKWSAGFSISYIPVSRTITLDTPKSSFPGVNSSRSTVKTQLNPIVTYVNIGYRF